MSAADNWAPPIGGMGLRYFFGSATPLVIVWVIDDKLPSPQSQAPNVRSGPSGVPLASAP